MGERKVAVKLDLRGPMGYEAPRDQVQLEIRRLEGLIKDKRVEKWMTVRILPSGQLIVSLLQGGVRRGSSPRNRKAAVNTTQAKDGYSIRWEESELEEDIA